jgi:hypothetical protein
MVDPSMDVGMITWIKNLISEVGFPIFVSGYLLYMKHKQDQAQQKLISELRCVQDSLLETKLQIGEKVVK